MSETPDQAATRRRWITLAELVAVAGVVIAALGLWNSWSDRRDVEAEHARTVAKQAHYTMKGTAAADGKTIKLVSDDTHTIGTARVTFPAALGVGPQETVTDEIDADWFAKPMLKLTDGGADDQSGRLPVLVVYDYRDDDGQHQASGIYDIVWRTNGRRVLGRRFAVVNFRLRREGGTAAELDRLWKKP